MVCDRLRKWGDTIELLSRRMNEVDGRVLRYLSHARRGTTENVDASTMKSLLQSEKDAAVLQSCDVFDSDVARLVGWMLYQVPNLRITDVEVVAPPGIFEMFHAVTCSDAELVTVWHGTSTSNCEAISRLGLRVPGEKGVEVVNGSSYGVGVYTACRLQTSLGYCRGFPQQAFVCVVKNNRDKVREVAFSGDTCYVISESRRVVPLLLVTLAMEVAIAMPPPEFADLPETAAFLARAPWLRMTPFTVR